MSKRNGTEAVAVRGSLSLNGDAGRMAADTLPLEEIAVKELCYAPNGQDQWRFDQDASQAQLNELAQEGWRTVSVFSTTFSQFRSGPHILRARVYAVLSRPLRNGATASG